MESRQYDSRANAIFRNQPSYTYFNKSFDNLQDSLFLSLHEIDGHFLQPQQLADKRAFETFSLNDPRTQKALSQICYDHTQEIATKLFYSPKWSSLNAAQHAIGARIVKARQEGTELDEDDFLIWYKMEGERLKESQEFQKFVYAFSQTNKEQMYTPAKMFMDLYKKWYERKTNMLLMKYPSESYNTHLGLPHLRVCKEVIKEQWAEIVEEDCHEEKRGSNTCWTHNKQLDIKPLHRSLPTFLEEYMNSEDLKENLGDVTKSEFIKNAETESADFPQYFIPLDSLMFLLTAGDYIDLPTEMLVDIKENEDSGGEKYVIMDFPLPSRQMGWHTFKQVMEQGVVAFISLSHGQDDDEDVPEISACPKEPLNFQVQAFDEFMKTSSLKPPKKCKFSHTLSKWQLKAKDKEISLQIFTLTDLPPQNTRPYSIKLEHKPKFGCELMSKYEILREWFTLKLQKQAKSTCYRLDINNFQTLLEETQSLQKLELQLSATYHILLPQLLSNLYEFLSLLTTMPCGHYMLRYNPKFKDKMMLCKPSSQEITPNTVHLHQLLKTEPSELLFMSQQNYLPIADNLCSLMHMEHRILPCTFRPSSKIRPKGNTNRVQKPFVPLNDKDLIVTRYKNQKKLANKWTNVPAFSKSNKKKAQRARRTKRLANQQPSEAQEQDELQREIELDQKMLGN